LNIAAIDNHLLSLPYHKPLITAANRFVMAEGVLVEIRSEAGLSGYGYIDVFPRTGETPGSAQYAIDRVLKPALMGRDLNELGRIKENVDRMLIGNPRVKSGVETALYDLLAKSLHVPVHMLLGGLVKHEVRIVRMTSLDDPEAMAEEAQQLVTEGYSAVKLKMSGDLALDMLRATNVRKAVGDGVFLKVDANEAYDAKSAIRLAKHLADLDVEIFEQPVPRHQTQALLEVKTHSPIKIEADQSVTSAADAYRLIRHGAVDSINTSLLKAGGFVEARRIAELCRVTGVGCALSNTAGSMVGDAAALQLAASNAGISSYCELGEFTTISGDPFTGLEIKDGRLRIPQGEGLGVQNIRGAL